MKCYILFEQFYARDNLDSGYEDTVTLGVYTSLEKAINAADKFVDIVRKLEKAKIERSIKYSPYDDPEEIRNSLIDNMLFHTKLEGMIPENYEPGSGIIIWEHGTSDFVYRSIYKCQIFDLDEIDSIAFKIKYKQSHERL